MVHDHAGCAEFPNKVCPKVLQPSIWPQFQQFFGWMTLDVFYHRLIQLLPSWPHQRFEDTQQSLFYGPECLYYHFWLHADSERPLNDRIGEAVM